jgi:hypothetical protein
MKRTTMEGTKAESTFAKRCFSFSFSSSSSSALQSLLSFFLSFFFLSSQNSLFALSTFFIHG